MRLTQFAQSPFADKVRRGMRYKGLPFEIDEIPLKQVATVARQSPTGKLPTLELDDGRLLVDSTTILRTLESLHPEPALLPEQPALRALCHILEDWADESLYFYQMCLRFNFPHNARRHVPGLAQGQRSLLGRLAGHVLAPNALKVQLHQQGLGRKPSALIIEDLRHHYTALNTMLAEQPFLIGEHLTLADVAVFAQVDMLGRTDEGERLLEDHPPVAAWLKRVDDLTAEPQPASTTSSSPSH